MLTPASDQEPTTVADLLGDARRAVDPVLRSAVASLPESLRRIASYHFGWEHADGSPASGNAGKAIRPALVLASARASGADRAGAAVPAAAAIELVHNFTLIHDDVMDRDVTRRHRPTAWSVFGAPAAILAGDALQALAQRLLVNHPHPAAVAAMGRIATCVIEVCEGQQLDCAFEKRLDVALDECLSMSEAKTGALLGCACALGALYAGAPVDVVASMDAFGREVGIAFQLIDDLIGIWGDPAVTGKPAGADLAARKKSLPVVAALTSRGLARDELAALYRGDRPLDAADIARAARAVDAAGGRDWAQAEAAARMAAALDHLSRAVPTPEATGDLLALADLVTRRDR